MTSRLVNAAVVVIAGILLAASATTYPRLATEHSLACKTCHLNPNGGGMRTEFGNHSVALNELTLTSARDLILPHVNSPRVAKSLLVGFDSRYLVFDDGRVFRMQTDAFLAFNPFRNFYYHFRFWESGITENYALMYFSGEKYYAKLGRFYPAFGLRNVDHTAFNRVRTGHGPNFYLDGFSLGAEVEGVNLVGEAFNPDGLGVYGLHAFFPAYIAPFGLLAGASWRHSEEINGSNGDYPHARAVFGGVSYDRFTALGELDIVGKSNDTLITYSSLTGRVIYGLWLVGEYNFFDGDRDLKSGVEEFVRFSAEFYPMPFALIRPSYTYYLRGPLENEDDFFVQLHVGY